MSKSTTGVPLDKTTATTLPVDPDVPEQPVSQAQVRDVAADAAPSDMKMLAEAILMGLRANAPRKIIPFGQQNPTNAFNPTGKRGRKLHKKCYQNGFRLGTAEPDGNINMTDEEIALIAQVRPGHYVDNLITVVELPTVDGGELHINYKNKTADQRMQIGSRVGSFAGMLKLLIKEYDEQQAALKAQMRKNVEEAFAG